ncbi:MAG: hypothetical protein ABSC42_07295 [Tepidisphaeraceae bacterium]|jgi:hypothetical protein
MWRGITLTFIAVFVAFVQNSKSMAQPVLAPPNPRLQKEANKAEADVKVAAFELDLANKNLKAVQDKLEDEFKQNPDWIATSAKLDAAKSALSVATERAAISMASNPDFVTAKTELDDAQDALDKAKSDGEGPSVIAPLAVDRMKAAAKVTKVKDDVVNNNAVVISARADMAAAQSAVDKLRSEFLGTLSSNADWNSANQVTSDKKENWVAARAKSEAADQSLRQDEDAKEQEYNGEVAQWNADHPQYQHAQHYEQIQGK